MRDRRRSGNIQRLKDSRPFGTVLLAAGLLAILAGGTFTLQGIGLIGPQSSFMVDDRAWIAYGLATAAVGAAVAYAGFAIRRTDKTG